MAVETDGAAAIREGEELDLAALGAWLDASVPELAGAELALEQFPRGHSNLTYLLRADDRELVLRRPPFGAKIKSAHDMGREYRLLSALEGHYARIPRAVAMCEDESVLGAPFYIMERLRGVIVRKRLPEGWTDPTLVRRMMQGFVENLAEIHRVDWRAAGLEGLYRGEGYVTRQVSGWTRRYDKARTDAIPEIDAVSTWLADNLPAERPATLIHNDYKHDNLVLAADDPARILGVLDWEMATIGDPLMDLGTTLGYWIEAADPPHLQSFAFCPSNAPGAFTRRELVDAYAEATGREVERPVFYFVYGLFKLAVVAQQIYARYKHGHTKDPRFARFIFGVKVLGQLATRAIEKDAL